MLAPYYLNEVDSDIIVRGPNSAGDLVSVPAHRILLRATGILSAHPDLPREIEVPNIDSAKVLMRKLYGIHIEKADVLSLSPRAQIELIIMAKEWNLSSHVSVALVPLIHYADWWQWPPSRLERFCQAAEDLVGYGKITAHGYRCTEDTIRIRDLTERIVGSYFNNYHKMFHNDQVVLRSSVFGRDCRVRVCTGSWHEIMSLSFGTDDGDDDDNEGEHSADPPNGIHQGSFNECMSLIRKLPPGNEVTRRWPRSVYAHLRSLSYFVQAGQAIPDGVEDYSDSLIVVRDITATRVDFSVYRMAVSDDDHTRRSASASFSVDETLYQVVNGELRSCIVEGISTPVGSEELSITRAVPGLFCNLTMSGAYDPGKTLFKLEFETHEPDVKRERRE